MSNEQNINQISEDNKPESPPETNGPLAEIPVIATTEEQRITNNLQPTANMEVHHHPQVEKKSFKEYVLEGLMIFLAVTMGFIAENIRENISENTKAKELAETLYQEVLADSVNIKNIWAMRTIKEDKVLELKNYFADSSLTNPSVKFMQSFAWFTQTAYVFEPKDGILNQLRNSGSLRYFKNLQLQKDIADFSVAINLVRSRNENEYTFVINQGRQFAIKYFDFDWYEELSHHGNLSLYDAILKFNTDSMKIKPTLRNISLLNRGDEKSLIGMYLLIIRSTRQFYYSKYITANQKLLQTLRKEYHLEHE